MKLLPDVGLDSLLFFTRHKCSCFSPAGHQGDTEDGGIKDIPVGLKIGLSFIGGIVSGFLLCCFGIFLCIYCNNDAEIRSQEL